MLFRVFGFGKESAVSPEIATFDPRSVDTSGILSIRLESADGENRHCPENPPTSARDGSCPSRGRRYGVLLLSYSQIDDTSALGENLYVPATPRRLFCCCARNGAYSKSTVIFASGRFASSEMNSISPISYVIR
jgi:hypothetical protein